METVKHPPTIVIPTVQHYQNLNGPHTAHLVIDLQEGFVAPGAPFEVPAARKIIPAVNRISRAVRAAGGVNIFIRFTVDRTEQLDWTAFRELTPPERSEHSASVFRAGTPHHALWSGLEILEGDLIMDKTRPSAFIPGTCGLDGALRKLRIDTVIVTGALTNCCCESTARDAMQMNYRVLFPDDATAAICAEDHDATLRNLTMFAFADVRPADEIVALLARS